MIQCTRNPGLVKPESGQNSILTCLAVIFLCGAALCGSGAGARAQTSATPVYTDDSPDAWQMFHQAADQRASGNASEAIRLYQRLLVEFPRRLLPRAAEQAPVAGRSLTNVRRRVLDELRSDENLLELYSEMSAAEAERLLADDRLEELYMSWLYAPAGADGALRLAERQLRRARFDAAAATLAGVREHPRWDEDAALRERWAGVLALVGLYGQDDKAWGAALETLNTSGAETEIESLLDSRDAFEPPQLSEGHSPLESAPNASLASVGRTPAWRYRLSHREEEWELRTLPSLPSGRRSMGRSILSSPVALLPTFSDDLVILTDGFFTIGVDRYDGHERWRASLLSDEDLVMASSIWSDRNDVIPDVWGAVAHGEDIITLLRKSDEHVLNSAALSLAAIDRATGNVLWAVAPGELHGDLSNAEFIGVPIVQEGLVISLARKEAQSLLTDYIVAVNLGDGSLAWRQHLASRGRTSRTRIQPVARPLVSDGVAYVLSPLGAIAAIEAATGLTRWIQIVPPVDDNLRNEPWEFDTPVMTPTGFVTFTPDHRAILVLDPSTGERLEYIAASTWGSPRYIVGDGGDSIYAIGSEIYHVPVSEPTNVTRLDIDLIEDDRLRGRVVAAGGRLIIPITRRMRLVNGLAGGTIEEAPVLESGTPLVAGAEVVIATPTGLDSYLPYDVGAPRLNERLAARPGDPLPAISLATLAFRLDRSEAIVPAVDIAIDIIERDVLNERHAEARERLFQLLLEIGRDPALAGTEIAANVFERLDLLANSAGQRVLYLLAHGDYLEKQKRFADAVEEYQTILATPVLANEFWSRPGRRFRARLEATSRLQALLEMAGPGIYVLFDETARREFERLQGTGMAGEFMALAEQFPLATTAPAAALEAARRYDESGRETLAIMALRAAAELGPDINSRAEAIGALLGMLRDQSRLQEALRIAESLDRLSPDLRLPGPDGFDASPREWLEYLRSAVTETGRMAKVGPLLEQPYLRIPGEALLIPERGLPSPHLALVRDRNEIRAHGGPEFAIKWRAQLDTARVDLVMVNSDYALLVTHDRQLVRMRMADGIITWRSPAFDTIFGGDEAVERRRGQPGSVWLGTVVTPELVLLGHRDGRVAAIDRNTGVPRWFTDTGYEELTHLEHDPASIILAGHYIEPSDRLARRVQMIRFVDPMTGEVADEMSVGVETDIEWLTLSDAGDLVFSVGGVVTDFDLYRNEAKWTSDNMEIVAGRWPLIAGRVLLLASPDEKLLRISLESGEIIPLEEITLESRDLAPPRISSHRGLFVLKTARSLHVVDGSGNLVGEPVESNSDAFSLKSAALAEDRITLIKTENTGRAAADRMMKIFQTDYSGKRLTREMEPDEQTALPTPDGAQAIDGWIVVDAGAMIQVFGAPAESSAP